MNPRDLFRPARPPAGLGGNRKPAPAQAPKASTTAAEDDGECTCGQNIGDKLERVLRGEQVEGITITRD